MFNISKTFECCYGHRVWNQSLKQQYSLDNACVCRHLHGHQMRLMVGLKAKDLEGGMVTDFKHLNCIKKLVDDVIDHKFIMDINDPLFSNLFPEIKTDDDIEWVYSKDNKRLYGTINLHSFSNVENHIFEKLEGLVVVDFVPTSENLCRFFGEIAKDSLAGLLDDRIKLSFIEFWETPKSQCVYNVES
ncbi:hypothetical phage protein [Campylobacter phage CPt10]|nr:QueD-like 6-pyruvoyl-tetrahydropterin synthase [Campylobacter phage CPt10]CBJ94276.1 hypothetical phage protein [Campylobacter phage CPt10]